MYIPIGGQVPFDEPVRLPPANPAEEAALNQMIADNRLGQWRYVGQCLYHRNADGTVKTVTINGIDAAMLNARLKNVFGSWPMPGQYQSMVWPPSAPANCIQVLQYPT